MLEAPPDRTVALVVGVDCYEYGDRWSLKGPASDALRSVEWLLRRGVKRENIKLFLSKQSWTKDETVAAWVAEQAWTTPRNATRDDLVRFVDKDLPKIDADAVFIHWGGHGVVDDRQRRNYLYTEDAAQGRPYCVCVQDLTAALRGKRFRHLREQVGIFDACANPFANTRETVQPSAASFVLPDAADYGISQFLMFAAALGKRAANISERRSGLFSETIFKRLKAHEAAGWPDFRLAFEQALADLKDQKQDAQQPFVVINSPQGGEVRSGRPPGPSPRVTSLLAVLKNTVVSPARLYRVYLRSLADPAREVGNTSIELWLRDLDDARARTDTHPPSLIEFAERLGRELKNDQLKQWVVDNTEANVIARSAMHDALNAEEKTQRPRATLFIEIDVDDQKELRWWIHAPDPAHCSAQQVAPIADSLGTEIATRLRSITAQAERTVGHKYDLVVGFIVPDKLLLSSLESTKVTFDDEGLVTPPTPLNKRYPVTLHWHRRARAPSEGGGRAINAWKQALMTLGPRIQQGYGANVVWLDPALPEGDADRFIGVAMKLLDPNETGICVGLGPIAEAVGDNEPSNDIVGCLKEGVPCFFWFSKPPANETDARKILCEAFAQQRACDAPVNIGKARMAAKASNPLSSVRMVWDEPGHLPSTHPFESPPQEDKT